MTGTPIRLESSNLNDVQVKRRVTRGAYKEVDQSTMGSLRIKRSLRMGLPQERS